MKPCSIELRSNVVNCYMYQVWECNTSIMSTEIKCRNVTLQLKKFRNVTYHLHQVYYKCNTSLIEINCRISTLQ
jgi:succinyl-CoA synthetase beta subunit